MGKTILCVSVNGVPRVNPIICKHINRITAFALVKDMWGIPNMKPHSICLDCFLLDPPTFHESTLQPGSAKKGFET